MNLIIYPNILKELQEMIIEADIDGDGQVDPEMVSVSNIILSGQFY